MFQMAQNKKFMLKPKWKKETVLLFTCILAVSVFLVLTMKVCPVANDKYNFLNYSLSFAFRADWKLWLAGLLGKILVFI